MSKISKEELKDLQESQGKLNAIKHDLGLLETQKHSLLHEYAGIVDDIEKYKKELEDIYGAININIEDGTFTKIEKE